MGIATWVIPLLGVTCFVATVLSFVIYAPEPYMDEVFHIPQTWAYCDGDYGRWDPKITTLPGLYIIAVMYVRVASLIGSIGGLMPWAVGGGDLDGHSACTTGALRQVNWLFSLGTLVVMQALLRRRMSPSKALAHAIALWLYPVGFFFGFLFYTDAGSTFFILLCYLLATRPVRSYPWGAYESGQGLQRQVGSALSGCVAILFRQTNAVWVAFTMGTCLLDDLLLLEKCAAASKQERGGEEGELGGKGETRGSLGVLPGAATGVKEEMRRQTRKTGSGNGKTSDKDGVKRVGTRVPTNIAPKCCPSPRTQVMQWCHLGADVSVGLLVCFAVRIVHEVRHLTIGSSGGRGGGGNGLLVVPLLLFAGFLVTNGGSIVVGDAENHTVKELHFAQMAYLSAVTASLWGLLGPESVVSPAAVREFFVFCRATSKRQERAIAVCMLTVGLLSCVLYRYSLAHPFLLSDNRHYTFYVWAHLLRFPVARAALSPAYLYCAWLIAARLRARGRPPLWILMYAVASALVLVPSPLLEPRYLTVPLLLAHLEAPERSWVSLGWGVASCVAVNLVVIGIFLARPFVWGDGSVARFMW